MCKKKNNNKTPFSSKKDLTRRSYMSRRFSSSAWFKIALAEEPHMVPLGVEGLNDDDNIADHDDDFNDFCH